MSVKESLIRARSLIDTQKKWESMRSSPLRAIYLSTSNVDEFEAAFDAYSSIHLRGVGYANVIATFNRAIAVAK